MQKWRIVRTILALFLAVLLVFPLTTRAAADDNRPETLRELGRTYLEDTKYLLTSPREWEREDWLKAALLAGTTLILLESDREIREYCQERRSDFGDDLSGVLDTVGNGIYLAPALGLWYLYGRRAGDCRVQEAAGAGLESLVLTTGMVGVVKLSCGRSRPCTGEGSHSFEGPKLEWDDDRQSFTSLHSAAAFAVATVMADYWRERRWAPVLAYGTATLVAWSRVNDDEHWSSDVFAGSVLGYYTAKLVLARRAGRAETVTVTPTVSRYGTGLALQYRF